MEYNEQNKIGINNIAIHFGRQYKRSIDPYLSESKLSISEIFEVVPIKNNGYVINKYFNQYDIVSLTDKNLGLSKVDKIKLAFHIYRNDETTLFKILEFLVKTHPLNEKEMLNFKENLAKINISYNGESFEYIGITRIDPTISNEIYETILRIIYDVGEGMERHVKSYSGKDEPDLTSSLLIGLNSHKGLIASGETFNLDGKTDILVNSEGYIVFVAECKLWRGDVYFKSGIEQLFSRYLSWRDNKAAVIVFNTDNKNLFNILDKIPSLVDSFSEEHGYNCTYLLSYAPHNENAFRFVLDNKEDGKKTTLTVIVFHLYSE